mmetsp:Transcript_81684/g.135058  ORF Transcript_81684/g.135058 Transcript_81684/m.135058 type:complete len:94 (-) Transcript_81684:315-596(-)
MDFRGPTVAERGKASWCTNPAPPNKVGSQVGRTTAQRSGGRVRHKRTLQPHCVESTMTLTMNQNKNQYMITFKMQTQSDAMHASSSVVVPSDF